MTISEEERTRNREAQRKFRLTHPNYGRKYPERQRRYYLKKRAQKLGITYETLAKPNIKNVPPKKSIKRYRLTKEQEAKKRREYCSRLKIKVLTHYGRGKLSCVICGESRPECLSIDHINGNGNKHRKEVLKTRYCSGMYAWLKRNNYPEGFQTLCMNCQFVKRIQNKELSRHDSIDNDTSIKTPQLPFIGLTTT